MKDCYTKPRTSHLKYSQLYRENFLFSSSQQQRHWSSYALPSTWLPQTRSGTSHFHVSLRRSLQTPFEFGCTIAACVMSWTGQRSTGQSPNLYWSSLIKMHNLMDSSKIYWTEPQIYTDQVWLGCLIWWENCSTLTGQIQFHFNIKKGCTKAVRPMSVPTTYLSAYIYTTNLWINGWGTKTCPLNPLFDWLWVSWIVSLLVIVSVPVKRWQTDGHINFFFFLNQCMEAEGNHNLMVCSNILWFYTVINYSFKYWLGINLYWLRKNLYWLRTNLHKLTGWGGTCRMEFLAP